MTMTATEFKYIIYEKRDRKAYITLNRPEAMNALSTDLLAELHQAMADYQNDDDLLVAIVTGAGGRAFSAGADLKQMANRQASGQRVLNPGAAMAGLPARFGTSSQ